MSRDSKLYGAIEAGGTKFVGAIANDAPVHGLVHPEMGHLSVRRHPLDQGFTGVCPFHGDCLEGLASGPAISPQRIILRGGVMNQTALFPMVRERMLHWLAGYIDHAELLQHSSRYVVPAALGGRAGVMGALALATEAGKLA